jgi:hypothetical protein
LIDGWFFVIIFIFGTLAESVEKFIVAKNLIEIIKFFQKLL